MVVADDCIKVMSTLSTRSVDLILTDPPYEENVHQNQIRIRKTGTGEISAGTEKFEIPFPPLTAEFRFQLAEQFVRISKGWIILFCQQESVGDWKRALEYAGGVYKRCALWVKPNAQPQLSGDRPANGAESIVCAYSNPRKSVWNGGGKVGLYHALHDQGRVHPTQKPLALMEQLVKDFSNPGDLILDPFAGSGTTGVAAKRWCRQFLGIELDPDMAQIAHQRLTMTEPLFDGSIMGFTKPKQVSLFGREFLEGTTHSPSCQEVSETNPRGYHAS